MTRSDDEILRSEPDGGGLNADGEDCSWPVSSVTHEEGRSTRGVLVRTLGGQWGEPP